LKWPEWANWKVTTRWLPQNVLTEKQGFSSWRKFVVLNKPHQGTDNSLPARIDLERLCLMFGLILNNLWVGVHASKDESFAMLDRIPQHVIGNIHCAQEAKVDSGDIGEVLKSLEAALHGFGQTSRPADRTRSRQVKHDKEYVKVSFIFFSKSKTNSK
jgi:hypothetical protein